MIQEPRVWVPSLSKRYDIATDSYVPALDLNPAAGWGELCVVSDPGAEGWAEAERAVRSVEVGPGDFILAAGDVVLLAVMIARAAARNGSVRVLRWDRATRAYEEQEVRA